MHFTELPYCTLTYKKPLVIIRFKEDVELDVREIKELGATLRNLVPDGPYLLLSDVRVNASITSEGRRTAADRNEAPYLFANAVIVNNLAMKLTANFFLKFNKPHFRFKVFASEAKATEWLLQFESHIHELRKERA